MLLKSFQPAALFKATLTQLSCAACIVEELSEGVEVTINDDNTSNGKNRTY